MMKNKSILFVAYDSIKAPILHSQGIPHLQRFSKKGYKCGILTFGFNLSKKDRKYYKKYLNIHKIKWHFISHFSSPVKPHSLMDMIICFFYIVWVVLRYNYRIIHCRSYIAEFPGLLASLILHRKNIFDMRGLYPEEYLLSGYLQKGFLYRFYKCIERLEVKLSDRVIVVSNKFAVYIRRVYFKNNLKLFNQKVIIIPNCIEIEIFNRKEVHRKEIRKKLGMDNKIVMVYSGSLAKWHLWEKAVDFYTIIQNKYKNLFLLFLTYENLKNVHKYFNTRRINKKHYKIFNLKPDKVAHYLSASDLGLFFIYPDISKQVSSPIKFAEFLASGLPVITNYGIGDVPDIIKKYKVGLLYSIIDLDTKKIVLDKFKKFIIYLDSFKKKCRHAANKEFNIEFAVNRYLDIYKWLLNR